MGLNSGWAKAVSNDRPTKEVDGCLVVLTVSGEVTFPSKEVLVCTHKGCSARSEHIGQMPCKNIPGG